MVGLALPFLVFRFASSDLVFPSVSDPVRHVENIFPLPDFGNLA